MSRPTVLHLGGVLYWTIRTYNPDTSVLKDADSTPTVAVRKNGASTGDSVTVTKRSATTGIYDCSYDPAGEAEGDEYIFEETATVTGTTTGSATYSWNWSVTALALERGTNSVTVPSATDVATAVWTSGTRTLTSFGTLVSDTATAVWAAAGRTLSTAPPTAAEVATAVWAAGSRTLTSFGTLVADTAAAVWNSALASYTTAGSAGKSLSDLLTRIPAALFSGITSLAAWLGVLAGKTADTTTRTEVNATTAGTNYNETTDSLEAIRDRGDSAWTTGSGGTGGSGPTAEEVAAAVWAYSSRTLTSFGTLASDTATAVWASGTRTLTSFGTLVADTATAVWAAVSRTITGSVTTSAFSSSASTAINGIDSQVDAIVSTVGSTETKVDSIISTLSGIAASTATAVWASGTRTLTSFGALVADVATAVWAAASRTLTAFDFDVGGSGAGTGARTVTLTVRDSTPTAIQGATVRVSRTGESFTAITNASGVAVFSLDDATWTVSITANGFSFTPTSLVVSTNVSQIYTMTTAGGGVTPSTPPYTTGYWQCLSASGVAVAGAQVVIQASSVPAGSTGIILDDALRTITADGDGVAQANNLIKGAVYVVYLSGSTRKYNITVPATAGTTVALGSLVS